MRVEQLMSKRIHTCRPDDTLERAAQMMWDYDCGALPVCSGEGVAKLVGVITDRDIAMCAMFHPRPLRELPVSEAMARDLRVCVPEDSLAEAERIMSEAQLRRLPVVDERGHLLGLISLADLAREAARERTASAPEITDDEVGDTLAAICEPGVRRLAA